MNAEGMPNTFSNLNTCSILVEHLDRDSKPRLANTASNCYSMRNAESCNASTDQYELMEVLLIVL